MTGFIDIHTHILPAVDDGAETYEQAMELLRMANASGTRTVIFTPHYRGSYRKNPPQMLKIRFENLCKAAAPLFPDMQMYLGQEIYCDTGAAEALAEGKALTLNDTSWVLLEFPPDADAEQIREGIDAFLFYGYRPVVAHAERCKAFRKDEALLRHMLFYGAKLQLNADSILGKNGLGTKNFCHKLLQNRSAAFVASDAHDTKKRRPLLRDCFLYVHKKYGGEYAHQLFYDNPLALIADGDF